VVALRSDLHEHVLAEISRLGLHNIDRDAFTGLQIQPPAFVADVAVSSHLERDIDWLVRTVTLETEVLEVSTSVLRYPSPAGMQESRPTTDIRLILTATPTGATFFVDSWSIKNNNALPYCLSADSTIGWWITSPQPKEGKLWYGRIMVRRVLPEDKCIEPGETFTIPSPSACISVNLGRDGREGVFTALESQFGWVQQKPPLARFMERADAADIWSDIAQCYPYGKYRALDIN
jgi:hypothetical protein